MKRSLLSISAGLIATMAFAQGVTSVNVVGFNKLTLERGGTYLISMAFEDIGTNQLRAANVFEGQLPPSTKITSYSSGAYQPSDTRASFANGAPLWGWGPNGGSVVFNGFMSFWVKIPASSALASYDVILKGQVPDDQQIAGAVIPGLNQLGYPYTAEVAFSNTALYATSVSGDKLILYDPATTNYLPAYTKASFGANPWGPAGAIILRQGVGFWYRSNSNAAHVATQNIPYSL